MTRIPLRTRGITESASISGVVAPARVHSKQRGRGGGGGTRSTCVRYQRPRSLVFLVACAKWEPGKLRGRRRRRALPTKGQPSQEDGENGRKTETGHSRHVGGNCLYYAHALGGIARVFSNGNSVEMLLCWVANRSRSPSSAATSEAEKHDILGELIGQAHTLTFPPPAVTARIKAPSYHRPP